MKHADTPAGMLARAYAADKASDGAPYYQGARDMLGTVRNAIREYGAEDADMAETFDRALGFMSTREDAAY